MHDTQGVNTDPTAPRWRRVLMFALNALGLIIATAAASVIFAWLIGRVANDRTSWSQWLWWIPTPAALAAALIGVLVATRHGFRPRRRRPRVRRWLIVTLALLAYFALIEHRFLSRPPAQPSGISVAHWSLTDTMIGPERFADAIVDIDADLTILSNATSTRWHQRVLEWLGDGHRPNVCGPFTVLTRYPIRQLRWLIAEEHVSVAILEVDATTDIGRTLVFYLFDLPSDPRGERCALARRVRTILGTRDILSPDIALGDFNITRNSTSLDALFPAMRHAYDEAGHGYGATFHRRFPLFHIDHVLLADSVECTRYDLVPVGVGRHRPQVAWVR